MKDFAGKIAFITGGASGAGFGQAQIFSEAGMKVVIADVRQDHLDEAMAYFKQKGAPAHAIKLDVTNREQYAAAADEVEKVFGETPDLLVLTAGVNVFGPAEASTYDDYDWVVGVCFGGVVNGLVTFVPRMIKKGKGGHIASTVSWGAFGAGPMTAPYSAAKAGVLNLLESYFVALKPYGIGVTALCPANIRSKIYEAAIQGRPEQFKNTGYNVTEDTQKLLASIHANGMDPRVLADWLKKGVENEQFLVAPYPSGPRMVQLALERFADYASPEGMKRLEEKAKQPPTEEEVKMMSEREGYDVTARPLGSSGPSIDVGFGKAKKDLDWVDSSKKFNK
ncbi:NAD(P)-dependent dehydrogenase, short-chain alcohol dehydrogenase family [Sporobacter termitidis DSM 10068]|uniref:NAD(P)-dependent dehydrogenase, short-chain alcohol dehydrogenase family n=1 Tax=Sporobacter termitidis DSM 10068 TaxID=1123282 RepID=A0A1M5XS61_9FIRM|nr:SDR family oxidoreductase [Sporobacter termitidis]SHI02651.1 NAD(P)-dependent dehydrogenase, short-chain alcohol dehydrogenase family [Sporobacter termitidis DSM 10068]